MMIYDGETDPNVLKQKMLTGEYVIIGDRLDRLSGGPKTTSLSEQLQIGDSISFYRDGELVKTCTILAKACTVGTEDENADNNYGYDAYWRRCAFCVFTRHRIQTDLHDPDPVELWI